MRRLTLTAALCLWACGGTATWGLDPARGKPQLPPPRIVEGPATELRDDGERPAPSLTWIEPPALAENLAVLMPSNRAITLAVETRGAAGLSPSDEYFEWTMARGRGRLIPYNDGTHCRFLPDSSASVETVVDVRLRPANGARMSWTPPTLSARIVAPVSSERIDASGRLDGFEIGLWPDPRNSALLQSLGGFAWVSEHADAYEPPAWFYPVTAGNRDWMISRDLRLGDLALDRPWFTLGLPQWVAINPLLVSKIEDLAQLMHGAGYQFDHFSLIYGFRAPAYNLGRIQRDGEETLKSPFSMHMYGRAADLLIDTDDDLRLDDLNRDGVVDVHDAAVIVHFVNELDRLYRAAGDPRVGGAGLYDHHDFTERPVQSPYVHIDVRGYTNDDGTLIRWPARWPDTDEPIRWGQI
jgi:hypothetical protein